MLVLSSENAVLKLCPGKAHDCTAPLKGKYVFLPSRFCNRWQLSAWFDFTSCAMVGAHTKQETFLLLQHQLSSTLVSSLFYICFVILVGWIFFGGLTAPWDCISVYTGPSPREGERIDRQEKKKTTPTRTYCKRSRPLPYYYTNKLDVPAMKVNPAPSHHPITTIFAY